MNIKLALAKKHTILAKANYTIANFFPPAKARGN
jgi:hypothetical protein